MEITSELSSNNCYNKSQYNACIKMKEIIQVIKEYIKTRTENNALIINKFLQAYSVTIDVSVFDPDSSFGAQFYSSLHELFTNIDLQSEMAWNCVDLLCNACRNTCGKQALLDTNHFVPIISQMLDDNLSASNKKKLLVLLQNLTCGIKITYDVYYLPRLFKILTRWVEDPDQDISCFSISILVNVCFKNTSAMHTLSTTIDIKNFLKFCLTLQGPLVEILVCKIMVILNRQQGDLSKKVLLNLVSHTFSSIRESLLKNDPVILGSNVDFFVNIIESENVEIFKQYPQYIHQLDCLIKTINLRNVHMPNNGDVTPIVPYDPECINCIFKFIYYLDLYKLVDLSSLYNTVISFTLDWFSIETVCYQATILLNNIVCNLTKCENGRESMKLLINNLPKIISMLQNQSYPKNMESCKRLGSLVQLLRNILKSNSIVNELSEDLIMNIFTPILSDDYIVDNLPIIRTLENKTSTTPYVDAYIYSVILVYELSQVDASWLDKLTTLMGNNNIQSFLALGLLGSDSSVKKLVLELAKNSIFPTTKIAESMESVQNYFVTSKMKESCDFSTIAPIMTYNQSEQLDRILNRLINEDISNLRDSDIIELYEYKLSSITFSELSASNALKAASDRCTKLIHRLSQLSTEHNKLRQSIRKYVKKIEHYDKLINDLKSNSLRESKKFESEIEKRDKIAKGLENKLQNVEIEMSELIKSKENVEEELNKRELLVAKLKENGIKLEKKLELRETHINNATSHINDLNMQLKDLKKMLDKKEEKLAEITKHYNATKEVLESIKMAVNTNK